VSAPITTSEPTPRSALEFVHLTPVDGLRALAAILVVLFHAEMPGFGNGFVGVDVFFVLSGFLITSLLLRERLRTDSISLWGFYARRARRLFPAALFVLIVTAVLYQLWASPLEVATNRSGFSFASIYVSNWYFMGQATDYFAQDSAVSPVLHYWSLSVEEQFYLVWPIVMLGVLAIRSIRERLNIPFLVSLFIALFIISAVMNSGNETSAYFNTIARAYQLIAGATLAAIMLKWHQLGRPTNALTRRAPLIGAGSIILLLLVSTSLTSLGPWQVGVVGVIATVGILWGVSTAENSRVFAPLTTRSARSLGNWSYSIYLWHWPVIVLGGLIGVIPEFWGYRVPLVLVLTIGLAAATYHFLEKPVLSISLTTSRARKAAVGIGLVATIGAALISLVILRVPAASANLINTAAQGQQESDGPTADVLIDSSGGGKTVLVVGDSHANFWRQGFTAYAKEKGFTVVFVTKLSCPWMDIPALAPQSQDTLFNCQERLWDPAIAAAKEFTPAVTVLASRSVLSRDLLVNGDIISADQPGWADVIATGTQNALEQIAPFTNKIVIIEPMPETATSMLDCLSTGANSASCDEVVDVKRGTQSFEEITRAISADNPKVVSLSLDELICPDNVCPAEVNGIVTHRDNQHLTWDYAEVIMPQVDALLTRLGAPLS
jgi:peptidoglycan/LPS O-acetylase OafA/YrhL